jgi:hypothetical protein
MGSQKCRIVGKYQSVFVMINLIISTRTRKKLVVDGPGAGLDLMVRGMV